MASVVVMPVLGQTMEYGTIVEWMKNEGDPINKGEALVTIMSDKANLEVESDFSGIVRKILVTAEDGEVDCLTPIAVIGSSDEVIDLPTLLKEYE